MNAYTSERARWSGWLLAALCACAGCSMQTVKLQGTGGEGMNPNRTGGSGALQVYAFFLKKPDAFLQKDKMLADFLTKSVVDERKLPAFLEQEAVAVERVEIPPPVAGKSEPVTKSVDVPVEVTCVGLVASFQSHRDNDADVVWRLVVPVKSGACQFQVSGRRLVVPAPAEPAPKKKEATSATSSDG